MLVSHARSRQPLAVDALGSADSTPACPPPDEKNWAVIHGSHPFRVWYPTDVDHAVAYESRAKSWAAQMDAKIWPDLTELMHVQPVSRPLDICMEQKLPPIHDLNIDGLAQSTRGCAETPAFVEVLGPFALAQEHSYGVLAHEFMHVLQYALDVPCANTDWWRESTATWAEDVVYPSDDFEHGFAHSYFSEMQKPLPDPDGCSCLRQYGTYVFPQFIARSLRPSLVSAIWHRAEAEGVPEAIDDVLPGGLTRQWPRFTLDSWNADPVDQFKTWDRLGDGVAKETQNDVTTLGPGDEPSLGVGSLRHLSAKYFTYKFSPATRTVTFVNATPFADGKNPDAHVDAILDINGDKTVENWTGKVGQAFCLNHSDEHLDQLTLVFSNASPTKDMTPNPKARHPAATVAATDAGCTAWNGTVNATWGSDGVSDHVHLNLSLAPSFPSMFGNGFNFAGASYRTTGGSLSWSESGTDSNTGCSYSGSASLPVPTGVSPLVMLWRLDAPPHTFDGYEWLNATTSPWDPTGTEHSSCPDGNGGTIDDTAQIDLADATLPTSSTTGIAAGTVVGRSINGSSHDDTQYGPTDWTWHLASPG